MFYQLRVFSILRTNTGCDTEICLEAILCLLYRKVPLTLMHPNFEIGKHLFKNLTSLDAVIAYSAKWWLHWVTWTVHPGCSWHSAMVTFRCLENSKNGAGMYDLSCVYLPNLQLFPVWKHPQLAVYEINLSWLIFSEILESLFYLI